MQAHTCTGIDLDNRLRAGTHMLSALHRAAAERMLRLCRDVAGGSYRMGDVAVTFAGAAASCEKALRRAASPSDSLLVAIFGECCIQK